MRRQSEHLEDYGVALARLEAEGLVYPSFESRAEIAALVAAVPGDWPRDPDGAPLYPGTARELSGCERARRRAAGAPYALRLDMAAAIGRVGAALTFTEIGSGPERESGTIVATPARFGDVVPGRKEAPTRYHLSVVIYHACQGVTGGAQAGPVLVDQRPSAAAGRHGPAGAALSTSPPDAGPGRPQAVEIHAGDGAALIAARRRHGRPNPPHGGHRMTISAAESMWSRSALRGILRLGIARNASQESNDIRQADACA